MRRRQWIEIGDQAWCPSAVRDGLTDYLQFVIDRSAPYAPAVPLLASALRVARGNTVSGTTTSAAANMPLRQAAHVVDLGSGAGGPWGTLARALAETGVPVRVRLTDLHPNVEAFTRMAHSTDGVVTGEPRRVAADAVPIDLAGFRTLFSAFHHFPPTVARRVLADAAERGEGIAVFEGTRRDVRCLLLMLLVPLVVWMVTPWIRPFRWSRLGLTYLLPVIPLAALVDGLVSCLRTYTPDELRGLVTTTMTEATLDRYEWTAGETGTGPIPMTYLIGYPRGGAALSMHEAR